MKRLNPETGLPFKRGDVRADGYVFKQYRTNKLRKDGNYQEEWEHPDCAANYATYKEKYYKENKTHLDKLKRNYYNKHKTRLREYCRQYLKDNPAICNAIKSKRRAAKIQRTPRWLSQQQLNQIKQLYQLAQDLTYQTGELHHVDHIIPLQGKTVSGLHVPWNLQVITATDNLSKSNKLDHT